MIQTGQVASGSGIVHDNTLWHSNAVEMLAECLHCMINVLKLSDASHFDNSASMKDNELVMVENVYFKVSLMILDC